MPLGGWPRVCTVGTPVPTPSVLLLELDPQVACRLDLFLQGRGFRVAVAASVADALRRSLHTAPAAVVIGHHDELIEAEAAAARLRAVAGYDLPVVILADGDPERFFGVDAVLDRAAHPQAIVDALRAALRRRERDLQPVA